MLTTSPLAHEDCSSPAESSIVLSQSGGQDNLLIFCSRSWAKPSGREARASIALCQSRVREARWMGLEFSRFFSSQLYLSRSVSSRSLWYYRSKVGTYLHILLPYLLTESLYTSRSPGIVMGFWSYPFKLTSYSDEKRARERRKNDVLAIVCCR